MGMKILGIDSIFFSLKKDNKTRGHEVILVKDQCRLDMKQIIYILCNCLQCEYV